MSSPTLFDVPAVAPVDEVDDLAEAFRTFDDANPHVYAELVRLVGVWHDQRGFEHLGIAMLWEVMRWNLAIATDATEFKLNNNHKSFYARKLMIHEPNMADLFEVRGRAVECDCSTCVRGWNP